MPGTADSHVASVAAEGRPKVLYVMGAGRSGSTILGVALGNCEGIFFAGELDRWIARAGVPRDGRERRRFWAGVRTQVEQAPELAGGRATVLERSSALLDPRRWPARRRLRRRYRQISEQLYRAIAPAAEAQIIVDSSHYPLRARELQALSGIDLHLLLLVRDPQDVVASLGRRDVPERRFGLLAANAYLWLTCALSVLVFRRHPAARRMLVRHEDFLADPARVIGEILSLCGSAARPPDFSALHTGVPFHGNRLINSSVVALGTHAAARARSSRITTLLQGPWAKVLSRLRPVAAERSGSPAEGL
ncbi:MAG TPA: sulfotransferase [Solirubrobacteraceae bacterium]